MTAPVAPMISVCIANYNGMALIDACLRSVLEQDCRFDVEIIVHDDASTDESARYLRERYPSVVLIESKVNVGFCASNNRMVAAAKGTYVLLLNNDAELFPDALRTFYNAAQAIGGQAILGLPQYDAATGKLIDIGSTFDLFLNPIPNLDPTRNKVGMIIGACLWLPHKLWDELGGFPEWFGSLAEDMHLCCMARLLGYPVRALPDSGFRHWVGKSLGGGKVISNRLSTKVSRRAMSERNKNYVMCLTCPGPAIGIILPLHLLLLFVEGCILASIKCDAKILHTIYLKSIVSLWQSRRVLLLQRKTIQDKRCVSLKDYFSVFQLTPYKLQMLTKYGIPKIL